MKNYYRVMLGPKSIYADACRKGNFIGVDFGIAEDLTGKLPDEWRAFNKAYIPVYLKVHPDKTKVTAGLACGAIWTVSRNLKDGDIVLCPDGAGRYYVGEIAGPYAYHPAGPLPHRRPVRWLDVMIDRAEMSEALRNSTGSIGTVSQLPSHAEEIERYLGGASAPRIVATDETIEDPSAFAMEKHLEEFLVENWSQTELARAYDIYSEDGDVSGQQYLTDTGPIDILGISKDKKTLLVIELKKGRASDVVVGQLLRYMGYVLEELCEEEQTVRGIIIALEDDARIRRALVMTPAVDFFRYQVSFKLVKG